MRNVETITQTSFSLRPFILYIITKTIRFNYIQYNLLDKDFLRVEGMSEIQAKRFSWIDVHRFPLSMDKNHLIANDFYLLATPGCNYTQNYTDVILKRRHADLNCKKLPNTSHQKKILNLFLKKS